MSNTKRSRKNNSSRQQTTQNDQSQRSSDGSRRKRKGNQMSNSPSRCGDSVLSSSKLSPDVRALIDQVFNGDNDLTKELIEEPAVRLLEEITPDEALAAVGEFAERYKVAKHKILRSKAGYFRGVCQKYWKQNRETKKLDLLRKASINPSPNGKFSRQLSALVSETIESLFTPASGLAVSIIDDSVQRRLTSLTDEQAIEALHEFCSAVMYRQDRIRNMNAYLMNIIKRRVTRTPSKTPSEGKPSTPTPSGAANKSSTPTAQPNSSKPISTSIPRKPTTAVRHKNSSPNSSSSDRSFDDVLVMQRARSAGNEFRRRRVGGDPRLHRSGERVLKHESNPVHAFVPPPREDSAEAPPKWNLSARSAPYDLTRSREPVMRPRVFSEQLPTYPKRVARIPPPRPSSPPVVPAQPPLGMPTHDFAGYPSDEEDTGNFVIMDEYNNDYSEEDEDVASFPSAASSDDDGDMSSKPESVPEGLRPELGRGQRPSNGPTIPANVPRTMARNSRPVPDQQRRDNREKEYQQQIEKLQMENRELHKKLQQIQNQLNRMTSMGYDHGPSSNPAYHAQPMYGGYTPPTSGSNVSLHHPPIMHPSPSLLPSSGGNPTLVDPHYHNPPFMPMNFPQPPMQPPMQPPFVPLIPSNPNIQTFGNYSEPNAFGAFVPAGTPYQHAAAFAMGGHS